MAVPPNPAFAPADPVTPVGAIGLRLSAFYFALFLAAGIHMPFWPVWLAHRGLGPAEIGILFALGHLTRVVSSPLIGHFADLRGDRRRPLLMLAGATTAVFLLFHPAVSFWHYAVATVLLGATWSGVMPLGDSLSLAHARRGQVQYGRVRLWGSLSFIVATLLGGQILSLWTESAVFWALLAAFVGLWFVCWGLPDTRVGGGAPDGKSLWLLVRNPAFLTCVAASAVLQASHLVVYIFGTIHWRAAGVSDAMIGVLWAEGIVAEIALFAAGAAVMRRVGVTGMFLIAAAAGLVRWPILAMTTDLEWLLFAQMLHGITFGAAHLAAMEWIARGVPERLSASAQSLHGSVALGTTAALISPLLGPLYEAVGGKAFLAMAVLSAVGGMLALYLRRLQPADREA